MTRIHTSHIYSGIYMVYNISTENALGVQGQQLMAKTKFHFSKGKHSHCWYKKTLDHQIG